MVIGSFLNVLIVRGNSGENIAKGPSHCDSCRKALLKRDLIPIISYLVLRGKCRWCGAGIDRSVLLVEITTALVFLLIILFAPATNYMHSVIYYIFGTILVFIAWYDIKYYLVADWFILPSIIVAYVANVVFAVGTDYIHQLVHYGIGIIVGGLFFLVQFILTKGKGIGGGDIRIGMLMGAMLGWKMLIPALILSYLLVFVVAVILLATKKYTLKSRLPLAPYLALGTFLIMIFHDTYYVLFSGYLETIELLLLYVR